MSSVGLSRAMIATSVGVAFIFLFLYAIPADGCTKYVPLSAVEDLVLLAWKLWLVETLIQLSIISLLVTGFSLPQSKLFVRKDVVITFACFSAWRLLDLTETLHHASRCGDARDFVCPCYFGWANADALFWASIFFWIATLALAKITRTRAVRPS